MLCSPRHFRRISMQVPLECQVNNSHKKRLLGIEERYDQVKCWWWVSRSFIFEIIQVQMMICCHAPSNVTTEAMPQNWIYSQNKINNKTLLYLASEDDFIIPLLYTGRNTCLWSDNWHPSNTLIHLQSRAKPIRAPNRILPAEYSTPQAQPIDREHM